MAKQTISERHLPADQAPDLRSPRLPRAAGLAAALLGAVVLAGWALDLAALKSVVPGLVSMKANAAWCFLLTGAGLALAPWDSARFARFAQACGLLVFAIALLTLIQHLGGLDFGLDQLLVSDPGSGLQYPGRMATAASVAFAAAGAALFLRPGASRAPLILAVAGVASKAVAAVGALGLLGYALDIDVLYSWAAFSSVALHTAAGFAVLGTGLWLAGPRLGEAQADDARITRRATMLLVLATSAVGIAAYAVMENQVKAVLAEGLDATLHARAAQIHTSLENRAQRSAIVTTRPNLLRQLRLHAANPRNAESRVAIQGVIDSFRPHGFTAIVLRDRDGAVLARLGKPIERPSRELKLGSGAGTTLLWREGVHVRHVLPLADAQGPLGTVLMEQAAPNITAGLMRAEEGFGDTSELLLCGAVAAGFDCFPTHRTPEPFTLSAGPASLALLAQRALKGERGFGSGLDGRGRRVVAGYAPVSEFGLVALLQMESAEIYRPLRRQFQLALSLIAGISLAGFFLVRAWVRPLASSLEQRVQARSAELARFRAALDQLSDAIYLVDVDSLRIVDANEGALRSLGRGRDELIGRSVSVLFADRSEDQLRREYDEIAPTATEHTLLAVHRRKDGTEFPVEIRRRVIDSAGRRVLIGVARDMTERKQAELALRQSHEALERSNLELQRFAFVASHDLQTPMRGVASFADLLGSTYADKLDAQGKDWLRRIVESVKQLQTLVRDQLEYSRVDSQAHPFERVALRAAFDQAVLLLEASVREAGAEITCGELPVVMGDRSQLVQLMLNLIGNGLKYRGTEPPRVHVSAEFKGNEWTIAVRDNGIGIAPQHSERIFEIFKRLHDQQEYPGSGIGLAVCRRVVHRHGGRIWVESEPGRGSVFYFSIPDSPGGPSHGQADA